MFSDVFRRSRKGASGTNGLKGFFANFTIFFSKLAKIITLQKITKKQEGSFVNIIYHEKSPESRFAKINPHKIKSSSHFMQNVNFFLTKQCQSHLEQQKMFARLTNMRKYFLVKVFRLVTSIKLVLIKTFKADSSRKKSSQKLTRSRYNRI